MKNKIQNNKRTNNAADHFWEKPAGKILISVIAGTIVLFIGLGINHSCTRVRSTANVPSTQNEPNKETTQIDTANKKTSRTHEYLPPTARIKRHATNKATIPVQKQISSQKVGGNGFRIGKGVRNVTIIDATAEHNGNNGILIEEGAADIKIIKPKANFNKNNGISVEKPN